MLYLVDRSESGKFTHNSVITTVGVRESDNIRTDTSLIEKLLEREKKSLPKNTKISFINLVEETKHLTAGKYKSTALLANFCIIDATDNARFRYVKTLYRIREIQKM